tara:strand:+ start:3196 stop:3312 length:117 start_codon:yes stop_codon:yes gene_type:complete
MEIGGGPLKFWAAHRLIAALSKALLIKGYAKERGTNYG